MQNPYIHLLSTSWKFAEGRRRMFVLTYAFFIVGNSIDALGPFILGRTFNVIQQGGENILPRVLSWLALYSCLPLCYWVFHGTARIWERKTAFVVERTFRECTFHTITHVPLKWHRDHHTGETYDKVEKAAGALQGFNSRGFQYLSTMMKGILSLTAILFFLPFYGIFALGFGVIILLTVWRFDITLSKNRRKLNAQFHRLASVFFDSVSNIKTIITLRLEHMAKRELTTALERIFPFMRREIYLNEVKWFTLSMLVAATTFSLLFLYIVGTINAGQALLIGNLTALYGYITRFSDSFFNVALQWSDIVNLSTNLQSAESIVRLTPEPVLAGEVPRNWQEVRVENVWFQYEDAQQKRHHIDNISLVLSRGKRIALVGESGSGKSTVLALLRGIETPKEGTVWVDGQEADWKFLHTISTLIPQDPELFEQTLEFNITSGEQNVPTQDVIDAYTLARFESVLQRLPQGLSTSIKERGVNLSGGEKQRLALARGIFAAKHRDVLLMDEPTSSVDPINELAIYRQLFAHFQNHCIVSSVHRLHLLPLFDDIYVLDHGKVVETGTYQALIQKEGGALKAMWENYAESSSVESLAAAAT